MARKHLTLMVIPQGGVDEPKSLSISHRLLWGAATILGAMVLSLLFFAFGYFNKASQEKKIGRVTVENGALMNELEDIGVELNFLKKKMAGLVREDEKLRILADLPSIDGDTRMMGIGVGEEPVLEDADKYSPLRPMARYLLKEVKIDLDQLLREADLEHQSFQEIAGKLNNDKDRLDYTPSIDPTGPGSYISSGFGFRTDPFNGKRVKHTGIDIAGRKGTPIYSTADGVVSATGSNAWLGWYIILEHKYGYTTIYGHLDKILVKKGQDIQRWQQIGEMGRSGRTTAPHLHYAVKHNGKYEDPLKFFARNYAYGID